MRQSISTPDHSPDEAVALLAELIRLQREVWAMNRQLDRIETEMRQALNDVARERFEAFR